MLPLSLSLCRLPIPSNCASVHFILVPFYPVIPFGFMACHTHCTVLAFRSRLRVRNWRSSPAPNGIFPPLVSFCAALLFRSFLRLRHDVLRVFSPFSPAALRFPFAAYALDCDWPPRRRVSFSFLLLLLYHFFTRRTSYSDSLMNSIKCRCSFSCSSHFISALGPTTKNGISVMADRSA